MDDREFLNTFLTERMQMHYSESRGKPTQDELDHFHSLETKYNQTVEPLSSEAQEAIKNYYESTIDRLTEDTTFFYCKGIKDGLLLHRLLENL